MKINLKRLALATASVGMLTIYGCGGGGSSTPAADSPSSTTVTPSTLSGTVAGGAAVIGSVTVTDSKGENKTAIIEANGHYTIDVGTMTGPFMLKAAGTVGSTSVTYYSAATTADVGNTVNVTPFTNLIVSNIAAQMAETYFSVPANIAKIGTLITPAALAAAQIALLSKLQPVLSALGVSGSIDLLRSTFAADHSGMDAVLDMVKVEVGTTTNIVTLKNSITDRVIAEDNVTINSDDAKPVDNSMLTGMKPTTVTDLQSIVAKMNSLSALFATSSPSESLLKNSNIFDTTNFMMGGKSYAEFASNLTTQANNIGMKFSNVSIKLNQDETGTVAAGTVTAVYTSNISTTPSTITLILVKTLGVWLIKGDGKIANVSITAVAETGTWEQFSSDGSVQYSSIEPRISNGIRFNIDPFSYNASLASAKVTTALITGPGLYPPGVVMSQHPTNTWMIMQSTANSDNTNKIPECLGTAQTQCINFNEVPDNSVYTFVLKDANGNSMNGAGYQVTLPKKPFATSTLTAAMFPAITSFTTDGKPMTPTSAVAGKSIAVTWTMPTGIIAEGASVNSTVNGNYYWVDKDLLPGATSALFGISTPTATGQTGSSAGVYLAGKDVYGRMLVINKWMYVQ